MTGPGAPRRYDVLGVGVDALDLAGALQEIEGWVAAGARHYVCFATAHGVTEALRSDELGRAYERSGITAADGMPLVWLGRLRGRPVARVYGPTVTLLLCGIASRLGWGCYFYGGAEGVAARLGAVLQERHPGLVVAGSESPPFRPLTPEEEDAVVVRINRARPTLVFVGLGCPRQELWMARLRARLEAPVLLGVGAAFDFHTGGVKQAPAWMQRSGLEWLFRLAQEPRRLWRRYLVTNAVFLANVALQLTGLKTYRRPGSA